MKTFLDNRNVSCLLVRTWCVRTHVVRARADVVATKLGIILSSSFFLLSFFHATYFSPRRGVPTILSGMVRDEE